MIEKTARFRDVENFEAKVKKKKKKLKKIF